MTLQVLLLDLFYIYVDFSFYLGNIYFADLNNNRIRRVTVSTGIITTIAGTGSSGYSGDNGPATSAELNYPQGVAVDSAGCYISYFYFLEIYLNIILGNVYIADTTNNCIRKVTVSTGIITTIAGTGTAYYSGDNGLAMSAELCRPTGVTVDSAGLITIVTSCKYHNLQCIL